MTNIGIVLIFLGVAVTNLFGQVLKGKVVDRKLKPIAFANVGVIASDMGTVSNELGFFQLNIGNAKTSDSLRISMLGYAPVTLAVNKIKAGDSLIIKMDEAIITLPEVVVSDRIQKLNLYGSKSVSGFMQTGWGRGSFGGERGVKISSRFKLAVHEVHFHISDNKYDSVLLRLRIRKLSNGAPDSDNEFLQQSIYFVEKSQVKGWRKYDVTQHNIILDGNAAVTLELVKYWGKCLENECFHISMAVPGKTFFAKHRSFSNWIVKKGRSPSIYVLASKL